MLQVEYWISELADKTGVSTRTIRYYIEEGLLPQPEVRGKYAIFTDDYLHRLELIKALKDSYLPLKEIKDVLSSLNEGEIRGLLVDMKSNPMETLSRLKALPVFDQPPRPTHSGQDALEYISGLRAREKPQRNYNAPIQAAQSMPSAPAAIPPTAREDWVRIELKPGMELHVRQSIARRENRLIEQLIEFIKQLSH
jgi:DNA-binding transcriptional MerR regulator